MRVGYVAPEDIDVYQPLLLPGIFNAIKKGEDVVTLALMLDDVAIGALAGTVINNRFCIASLYVAPEYRRRGGAELLMKKLVRISEKKVNGLTLNFTTTLEEHYTLVPFLEAVGFKKESENGKVIYMTTVEQAAKVSLFTKEEKQIGIPFSELDDRILSSTTKIAKCNYAQLPDGGLTAETVDKDLSFATIKDNRLDAYIVVDKSWAQGLTLSAIRPDVSHPTRLIGLLRSVINRMSRKYPPETKLMIQSVKNQEDALFLALFPDCLTQISYTYYRALN